MPPAVFDGSAPPSARLPSAAKGPASPRSDESVCLELRKHDPREAVVDRSDVDVRGRHSRHAEDLRRGVEAADVGDVLIAYWFACGTPFRAETPMT